MTLPVEINPLLLTQSGSYTIGRSLRFRSSASAYLNRTPTVAGNRRTWTWSGWVKRGSLGSAQWLFDAFQDANNFFALFFNANDTFGIQYNLAATSKVLKYTTQVFRDPGAWFHLLVAVDTTPATPIFTVYVNGSQVTSFGTNTNTTSQNEQLFVNNTVAHNTGRYGGAANYFDGYMAEVNFIDGQALTPSSFGANDVNGVWQPKKYTGTYGTNGFYLPFNWNSTSTYAGSFNGSTQYLTVPTNTAFDFGAGNFTIEAWVLTDSTTNRNIVSREYTGTALNYTGYILSTSQLVASTADGAWQVNFSWSLPSPNQWHHYALVRNGNVYTVYIDGIVVGTQTVAGALLNGQGGAFTIGYRTGQGLPNGNISNLRVVKGTAVYTAPFVPPTSPLTAISGTSLLTLQSASIVDNSANAFTITNVGSVTTVGSNPFASTVTADASGNNNNWAPNNINYSSYGTTFDSMVDSPTVGATASNYAVLNPLDKNSNVTVSNGNLTASISTTGWLSTRATIGMSSGKWYWETTTANTNLFVGIGTAATALSSFPGSTADSYGYQGSNGNKYNNNAGSAYGSTFAANDVIGIAFDASAGTLTFYKNGVSMGTAFSSIPANTYFPIVACDTNSSIQINFGQRPFSYTVPTGYSALNTYNLPAPTILAGNKHFDVSLWTGTGANQSIVNSGGFQPDLVWDKSRNNAGLQHILTDSVRGVNSQLFSPLTNAEETRTDRIQSFNSNGFTVGTYTDVNQLSQTFVGWQWKGGGAGVSNTAGSITSTVSANPTAGFSIVTYTGTGAVATVGHGLGVAPNMIIWKNRSSVQNWIVYNSVNGNTGNMYLNLTNGFSTDSTILNNTTPTSSVFTVGTSGAVNGSTNSIVAYCFAAVKGYSAFGSYIGNGSTDGPFIYCGFRPRWILIKNSTTTSNWFICDTSRDTYNVAQNRLFPSVANAEAASPVEFDFLSNGFKIRIDTDTGTNTSGNTYIYAAFAENPFNTSRAR